MRPITVGIIGAGNVIWAYLQILDRLLPRDLAKLGPVCARRREVWQDLKARRPDIRLVADVGDALRSDVDVVLIITPPESHAELVRMTLEHGKHVVVEKPAAATAIIASISPPIRARATNSPGAVMGGPSGGERSESGPAMRRARRQRGADFAHAALASTTRRTSRGPCAVETNHAS